MFRIFLSCILFISIQASACLNEYGHNLNIHQQEKFLRYIRILPESLQFDTIHLKEGLIKIRNTFRFNEDYKLQSNYAVFLMKLGRIDSSYSILSKLIEQHPDDYEINSNIGTCYELMDQLDSALFYIKKGIEINPDSHYGSEWIQLNSSCKCDFLIKQ